MSSPLRDQAVSAALALADERGLEALSMRKVAGALGVPVMTLYHHVRTKDELLDLLAEAVLRDVPPPPDDVPWDEALAAHMTGFRATLLRHPSLGALFTDRAVSGPSAYRAADATIGLLLEAGFSPEDAVDAFTALLTYTIGSTLFAIARSPGPDTSTAERVRLERLRDADPQALPAWTAVAEHLEVRGTERQFERGLRHLLDGLRAELPD